MITEVITLSNQIADKLNLLYNETHNYKVLISNDTIIVKLEEEILSGTYYYTIPGEIFLTIEEAKKFLDSLDKAIIINNYLGKNSISFKITRGSKIVFAMDGKEMSNNDITMLYQNLEMKKEKSPLNLAINMIKVKSLYEKYSDLYEQVVKKHDFLESYNELISSIKGKTEAIQFAKINKGTWGRLRENVSSRVFDITGDEDLVDTIVNGEKVSFNYEGIPLEKKKVYLTNLENYEHRINNLIERLEKEMKNLERYNEQVSAILESISNCNVFSLKPILDLPKYDCMSLEVILAEEKQKYNKEIYQKNTQPFVFKTIDEKEPWLKDVDEQQRSNLQGNNKKTALMLYKSFMYHLFNNIISYARNNNINLNSDELEKDTYIASLIEKEYYKYLTRIKNTKNFMPRERNSVETVIDDYFFSNNILNYKKFHDIVLENVVLLEPALSETILKQPLTVYRCVYEPINSDIYSGDLGNALLSTTTDINSVSDILISRKDDITFDSKKVIYKIELPAGSPIIAFTNDIYLKNGTEGVGFSDDQKEILIDSNNYDFEYVKGDTNVLKDGTSLYSVTLNAIPKNKKEKSK